MLEYVMALERQDASVENKINTSNQKQIVYEMFNMLEASGCVELNMRANAVVKKKTDT